MTDSISSFFTRRFLSDHCPRNLCRQDWLKAHEGGTEEDFKVYWNGLSEEEIKVRLISSSFCVSIINRYPSQLWKQAATTEVSIPVLDNRKSLMIMPKHQRKARKERKKGRPGEGMFFPYVSLIYY